MITWFGFLLAVIAAILVFTEHLLAAGLLVLTAGFFDILDGALARQTNQTTRFGSILDSTLDRLSEGVVLLSILALYANRQEVIQIMLVCVVLLSSLMVSYLRAKVEATGIECQVGLFTRSERVIVLALGLLLNQITIALGIIAVFSFVTVGQRLLHAWKQTRSG